MTRSELNDFLLSESYYRYSKRGSIQLSIHNWLRKECSLVRHFRCQGRCLVDIFSIGWGSYLVCLDWKTTRRTVNSRDFLGNYVPIHSKPIYFILHQRYFDYEDDFDVDTFLLKYREFP